ncbi:MAG: hypothetical protein ACM3PE_01505 [Deltaproteobacteria bacterium]
MNEDKPRVLIGTPIRQKAEILSNYLWSIKRLILDAIDVDFYFIDDNLEEESHQLIARFIEENHNTFLVKAGDDKPYFCNESTHIWEEDLIWKVAGFKNSIINKAREDNYDYLFLVDSDLVLQPQTLEHLVNCRKDIVSEIFWTKWEPDFPELPQVWCFDQYNLFNRSRGENLTESQVLQRVLLFLNELKVPGVYRVGGLGACTLISKKAIHAGVNFNEIYNSSLVGEDRHFCIRAAALGFELFVDTHYPAFHIYRLSDLDGLEEFKMRIIR